jgi:ribosomal protein S18 acetylase RimI-like enzyme
VLPARDSGTAPATASMGENRTMLISIPPGEPRLPEIAGATWRPLAEADAAAYARLSEACRVVDGGSEVTTEETARRELTDPHAPMATNTACLASDNGELLACAVVHERLEGRTARRVFLWGLTHPAHRGRGIGAALVGWAELRGREVLAAAPGDLPRLLEAFCEENVTDAIDLHRRFGFRPVRWYRDMRRDLREPVPAEPSLADLRVVGFDPGWTERLRLAHNEAFRDHWGSEPLPADVFGRNFVGDPRFRADLSFLVLDGEELAGYTINYVAEEDWAATGVREGWIGQLGVRRPWRRRGVATALLLRSLAVFRAAGLEAASLGVDTENPTGAVGLYERVGFRPLKRFVRLAKDLEEPPGPATGAGPVAGPAPRAAPGAGPRGAGRPPTAGP